MNVTGVEMPNGSFIVIADSESKVIGYAEMIFLRGYNLEKIHEYVYLLTKKVEE